MNTRKILVGSIILNLMLLGALGYSFTKWSAPVSAGTRSNDAQSNAARAIPARSLRPTAKTDLPTRFHWRQVESPDYKQYIANLRAIGCPEETIRDVIRADVAKLYATRLQALEAPVMPREFKFWQKEQNPYDDAMQQRNRERQALSKEQQNLLGELLGPEPEKEQKQPGRGPDYYDARYAFLPEEKRQQLRELMQKYSAMEQNVYRGARDVMLPEDEAELRRIREQKKTDLAQLLTPQELEDVSLRDSQTAAQMRQELGDFNMTEQEFRNVFRIRQGFDEAFSRNPDPDDKEFWKRREQAQKEIDSQLKALLGDQRYAEYQMHKDYEFQNLNRVAKRLDIPTENIVAVYDLKREVEAQATRIRSDGKLPFPQRQEAMKALRADAERIVTQALSESGYKAYTRQGGHWIRNLQH